jgi:hypothetical protein
MGLRAAIKSGDPRQGMQITKSAMKFDRQIVAIALVNGARVLYSGDDGVERFASICGLATKLSGLMLRGPMPFAAAKTMWCHGPPQHPCAPLATP